MRLTKSISKRRYQKRSNISQLSKGSADFFLSEISGKYFVGLLPLCSSWQRSQRGDEILDGRNLVYYLSHFRRQNNEEMSSNELNPFSLSEKDPKNGSNIPRLF